MNHILVILGHPRAGSFNHAIAGAACDTVRRNGHRVTLHDLCAERFDPCLPAEEMPENGPVPAAIRKRCEELEAADGIVIVHPNWWGQPPAILKGWIDRVIRPGIAYRFEEGDDGEGVPVGLLKAKAVLVFNTSNTPDEREKTAFGDPLDTLWRRCIFDLCGVTAFYRKTFSVVVTSTPVQRRAWLDEVAALTDRVFPSDIQSWILRYYAAEQGPEVMTVLSQYGGETWHREPERVKRDAVIVSRGSIDKLQATIQLAMQDYRDVLIGEEVDPWVIGELLRYGK
jgi:NAD(P)H dehydrogenase (quinone)